jgi:hypothetical protein
MPNFYTELCAAVSGDEDQLRSLYQMLDVINNYWDDEDLTAPYLVEHFPWAAPTLDDAETLLKMATEIEGGLGVSGRLEEGKLLLITDESASVDPLADIIQSWLRMNQSDQGVGIEFASTASRAVLDGYGGGAVFITRHSIDFMNTRSWLESQQRKLTARKEQEALNDRMF